ncbi:dipeptidyl aminopeptidase/acylaminoacyl peptidase [Caulobacter rhizosphaerae]|uniref:Dipeptidyl aminopeptidase/acylaminoacyl peptidase n=1 Tax=Caulobacter rhizosphaerae TaxID=2010972 RepID=A0ABU1MZ97_9CAUL|nr:prolyl oligopeptidase family serine peptidase [Caulobacter rhizosphaerae]MDR6531505.1 dipeptidyl aminopeptidase/acylaminoacyl peptidase [Caulobacter rhizosphaerae]
MPVNGTSRTRPGTVRLGLTALALGLATASAAGGQPLATASTTSASPAPLPPIAERYRRADLFLRGGLGQYVVDDNLQPRFVADGRGVLYRHGKPGQRVITYLNLADRKQKTVAVEADLIRQVSAALPTAPTSAPRIDLVDFDPRTDALVFTAAEKQWKSTRGVLAETPIQAFDPALSPDGRFKLVARDFNLFAVDTKTGREAALTTDGSREQPYGRDIPQLSQILKAGVEEPDMPVSAQWSPDSRRVLTWRLDTRGVKRLSITQQNPGGLYPRSFSYIYPLAGAATLPQAQRLVIDVEQAFRDRAGKIVPLAIPSESLLYPAAPEMSWDGDHVRAQWTQRGYGQLVVYSADPVSGAARIVAREKVAPLVTVTSSSLQPASALGGELAISERSGWAQLYLVKPNAPDGGKALTTGAWEVLSVDHVDPRDGLLVTGVGREKDRNPYYKALYRVGLDGAPPQLLTPEPLDHETTVSPDGRWILDEMSSPTEPTRTVLRDARDGRLVLELGRADPSALWATGFRPPEPFTGVAADGVTPLYGMIFRPIGYDPTRRYPVIDNVYTGPTTTQTPTSWRDSVSAAGNSVAQIGAVVVMIDGRGTSRRGQAFRLPAYQNLGEVGLDDHIAMIRQMAAKDPGLDPTRVGVFGGSAGGYDAARFVLRRPEFFKVAVASSGNHDLRLDKAWWPEVSMGLADEATWERNSNMSVAGNLQGKLLLVHGDIDDNVPVTESVRLANAIIQAGKDVDLVILPNTTHAVYQPFFWRKLRDYFTRNLLDEAPPAGPPPVRLAAAPTTAK